MTTLYDALLNLARRVRSVNTGVATGGTTTTLIDTVNRVEEDETFNGQTLFMLDGNNANTTHQIINFDNATSTITFSPAVTNAIADGDRYMVCRVVREDLVQAVNAALTEIGNVTKIDESLTVVADQTEYTLPAGIYNLVRVEVAASESADYAYKRNYRWREINGKLHIPREFVETEGMKLRLYYNALHDNVDADADAIDAGIPLPLLTSVAAYNFQWQQYANKGNFDQKEDTFLSKVQNDMYAAQGKFRVRRMYRDPIHGE